MVSPFRPSGVVARGRYSSVSKQSTLLPLALNAVTRDPMGRCFMRALPMITVNQYHSLDKRTNSGEEASSNSGIAKIEPFTLRRYGEKTFTTFN